MPIFGHLLRDYIISLALFSKALKNLILYFRNSLLLLWHLAPPLSCIRGCLIKSDWIMTSHSLYVQNYECQVSSRNQFLGDFIHPGWQAFHINASKILKHACTFFQGLSILKNGLEKNQPLVNIASVKCTLINS